VNVVQAFDGKNAEAESGFEYSQFTSKFTILKPAERGCFLSHMRLYMHMIHNNYPYALVWEDDAQFIADFTPHLEAVLKEYAVPPEVPNILFLGGRFKEAFVMQPHTCACVGANNRIVQHNYSQTAGGCGWVPADHDRTTHAYIVTRALAKLFVDKYEATTTPINQPIDRWIMNTCIEKNIPIYNSVPLLCHSPLDADSDIRHIVDTPA
jgi:GR25 family glycosyltransferase involved in LPS biosynthesis